MNPQLRRPASRAARLSPPWRLCHVCVTVLLIASASGQTNIQSGSGRMAAVDVLHPNGRIFDQVLMTGREVSVSADPGQVVRVSFLDPNDDILQVEFSGLGTVSIELDPATYRPPAVPLKYHQPGIEYVQGRATVRVRDTGPDSYLSVFSVGRGNAVNPFLFPAGTTYDAVADLARVDVAGAEMGAILTGNVRYSADSGVVGLNAPDTLIRYRVVVGEIDARLEATPVLRIGAGSTLAWDAGAVLVAGGTLRSSNGSPLDASSGNGSPFARINAVAGTRSSGDALPAGALTVAFASRQPGQIWVNGTSLPARGYVPVSFDELMNEAGFDAFDFGAGASVQFSGGNVGTYVITLDTMIEGEMVHARFSGGYSYAATGTHASRMTFTMTLGRLSLSSASVSYEGTIYELARMSGMPLPVSITAEVNFDSLISGTATMTIRHTNGVQESYAATFDADHDLDFAFL